jgi:hypothetical protein
LQKRFRRKIPEHSTWLVLIILPACDEQKRLTALSALFAVGYFVEFLENPAVRSERLAQEETCRHGRRQSRPSSLFRTRAIQLGDHATGDHVVDINMVFEAR